MVAILLLAPVLGDCLTGATPPVDVVLWPPGAVLLIALYGCGALLCREIAFRRGWIDATQLESLAKPLSKVGYGRYLLDLAKHGPEYL